MVRKVHAWQASRDQLAFALFEMVLRIRQARAEIVLDGHGDGRG